MLKSLERLRSLVGPPHSFRSLTTTFVDVDPRQLGRDLNLTRLGTDRGADEQPSSSDTGFDAVESKIIEVVGSAQKTAHDELENQIAGFRERLIDLGFEDRFSAIRDVSLGGLADLQAQQEMALDDLHGLRRDVREAEEAQEYFRQQHRIRGPAKIGSALGTTLKWLFIAVLVLLELVANGYFLSRGNELGLVGGIVEALIFSLLNIGVALLVAMIFLPFLWHRGFFHKLWGLIWLGAFLVWTTGLNLGLAHFREAPVSAEGGTSAYIDQAGRLVLERLATRPITLDDFESWLLFAVGVLFSIFGLLDGLSLRDRYPGYQAISDATRRAREKYADMRRARIQDLSDVREEYQETVTDLRGDLGKRRTEHEAIIAHRSRLVSLFKEHQTQLEKAANVLLREYRDANLSARRTPPPAHFAKPFGLARIKVQVVTENEIAADELKAQVTTAQTDLEDVLRTLGRQFETALEKYRQLDQLAPDR